MNSSQISLRLIPFCFLLLTALTTFSQKTQQRTLSYKQLIDEILNAKDYYYLSNATIEFNIENGDSIFVHYSEDVFGTDTVIYEDHQIKNVIFPVKVQFESCTFNGLPAFINTEFSKNILFYDCTLEKSYMHFDSCVFKMGIEISKSKTNRIVIKNSEIKNGIIIKKSEIKTKAVIINNEFTDFIDDTTEASYGMIFNFRETLSHIQISESKFGDIVKIINCNFSTQEFKESRNLDFQTIRIIGSEFDILALDNLNCQSLNFDNSTMYKNFIVRNVRISKYLQFWDVHYPVEYTNFSWNQIEGGKLCFFEWDDKKRYFANTNKELGLEFNFNELLSIYTKLLSTYKTRGDKVSANGCYVEMKDLETRRLNYLWRKNSSSQAWFDWRLNQFLRFFCYYGTSPTRSLIISMYVIFAFALFYFFFYSEWDRINRSFFIAKSKKLLTYFQSEQKMEDFYTDDHKDEIESYHSFKKQIRDSAGKIPFYMEYLMKPLYHLSLIRHAVISWLYRRTEILSGKWEDLTGSRKVVVGSVVGASLTFYLVYLILVRSLNSLFLSINTFSTLGFGDIPVKGISRYMAILEGFLGWFLLSIFSVSLISQILQN